MSKELQELEDKLLFDELNRRAKLLKVVQKGNRRFEWSNLPFLLAVGIFVFTLVCQAFSNDQAYALIMIVLLVTTITPISIARADTRLDALVKVLQEDGVLRDVPIAAKREANRDAGSASVGSGNGKLGG